MAFLLDGDAQLPAQRCRDHRHGLLLTAGAGRWHGTITVAPGFHERRLSASSVQVRIRFAGESRPGEGAVGRPYRRLSASRNSRGVVIRTPPNRLSSSRWWSPVTIASA